MTERFGTRYRLDETELDLLQMSGEETDWSYTPVPTLSKTKILFWKNWQKNWPNMIDQKKNKTQRIEKLTNILCSNTI